MKKIIILCLFISLCIYSKAQDKSSDTVKIIQVNEVIISANKTQEKRSEIPYQVETIKSRDIALENPQTAADMLLNTGTVFIQKSQMGGGSPVLRGFESSRVLIVVDGVRMNNAIYRAGHLQDVITLDNSMLDHTEVIFGPSSTMYGSDALGGVMHFFTKKPVFSDDKMLTKGNAFVRWSSAAHEKTGHLDLNLGWKKFSSLTSFSYSDFDDLRAGRNHDNKSDSLFDREYYAERINGTDSMIRNSDPAIQRQSAYSQYDLLQKFAFRQNEHMLHTLNIQLSNSSDVPRYDRLTEYSGSKLKYAEWYYGPQLRTLASLHTEITANRAFYDQVTLILAGQQISQDRISRRFKNNNKTFQMEDVAVYSLNADLGKMLNRANNLSYGLEATHNRVSSEAKTVNITTFSENPAATRYPDGGSTMSTYAAYIAHRLRISEKVIISDGIRFSASSLHATFTDTAFYPFPFTEITQQSSALTGNLGLVVKPASGWKVSLLGSSGFRTPNVDDLTKIFDSSPGKLIVANANLDPEHAYNAELGIEKTIRETVSISITGWYTKLVNAMVVKDFQYNGQDSVLYDGSMSRVQAVQNADDAFIRGISTTFKVDFNPHFSFLSTATWTYGRYHDTKKDTLIPLDHIPPTFGKTALLYRNKKAEAEFYALYNGKKLLTAYSPGGEDNLQYATPDGMPSWMTLNIKGTWKATEQLSVQAGLENILDIHYRYFASGISAPGRNVMVALRATF